MAGFDGLDDDCLVCGRRVGDHTMDEWSEHMGETETFPFTRLDPEKVSMSLGGKDRPIADQVVVKSAVFDGAIGPMRLKFPVLVHEFSSSATGVVLPVTTVALIGSAESIAGYAEIVAQNAARAIEVAG